MNAATSSGVVQCCERGTGMPHAAEEFLALILHQIHGVLFFVKTVVAFDRLSLILPNSDRAIMICWISEVPS